MFADEKEALKAAAVNEDERPPARAAQDTDNGGANEGRQEE